MKWVLLLSSIVAEVCGTVMLKQAYSGTPHTVKYSVAAGASYILCFALLGGAMRQFPLSVVYATWSGVGVSLLAIVGVVCFHDEINLLKLVSFLLVILGVIGLNLSGVSH